METQELTRRDRGRLWARLGLRAALVVLVCLALVFAVPPLLSLLMPFVLAMVLAWLLNPVIRAIQRHLGISRKFLSLLLLLLLFALVGGILVALGWAVINELISLANNWPAIWESLSSLLSDLEAWLSQVFSRLPPEVAASVSDLLDSLLAWVQTWASSALNTAVSGVGSFATRVPSLVMGIVMFVMGSYFITSDYPHLRSLVTDRLSPGIRRFLSQVKRAAVAGFGGYLRAQLFLAVAVFFILLAGFLITAQPYAVLLAFLLAVLDFVPIVGSGTVMVPWAVISLFTGQWRTAVELIVLWGIIAVFRQVMEPRVVGNQTGLSPILSLLSIYLGMRLAGIPGMILAPVLCMVVRNLTTLGLFDSVLSDLRLAVDDLSALLRPSKREPPPPVP